MNRHAFLFTLLLCLPFGAVAMPLGGLYVPLQAADAPVVYHHRAVPVPVVPSVSYSGSVYQSAHAIGSTPCNAYSPYNASVTASPTVRIESRIVSLSAMPTLSASGTATAPTPVIHRIHAPNPPDDPEDQDDPTPTPGGGGGHAPNPPDDDDDPFNGAPLGNEMFCLLFVALYALFKRPFKHA